MYTKDQHCSHQEMSPVSLHSRDLLAFLPYGRVSYGRVPDLQKGKGVIWDSRKTARFPDVTYCTVPFERVEFSNTDMPRVQVLNKGLHD